MSNSVRAPSSGWSWVCEKWPGTTRAPSFQVPECATASVAGQPPSSRRKCDLPVPFAPRTATRSP